MARPEKTPPKIHPKFDVKPVAQAPTVNTNLATTVPEGQTHAGTYLQYQVLYRLDAVGRKVVVSPSNLVGIVFN